MVGPAFTTSTPLAVLPAVTAPYKHQGYAAVCATDDFKYVNLSDQYIRLYPGAYGGNRNELLWLSAGDRLSIEVGIRVENSSYSAFNVNLEFGSGAGVDLDQTIPILPVIPNQYPEGNPWLEIVDAAQASNKFSWQVSES
jgi:hypothetical protein